MSEKLAAKHKNSLALKEHNSLRETHHTRPLTKKLIVCDQLLFLIITCLIFICYWFILCPLLFELLRSRYAFAHAKPWPSIWLFTYWLIAFLIWLFIMIILIILCKRCKNKEDKNAMQKWYGSSNSMSSSSSKSGLSQSYLEHGKQGAINSYDIPKERNCRSSSTSNGNTSKKHKDLPPLVIHRRMSGNDVENAQGIVKMGNEANGDDTTEMETEERRSSTSADRTSIKDYLKLVTVTPSEDEPDTVKSPKSPLSPRELFFIDLIREAEKAESNKPDADRKPVEGIHFFPKNFSPSEYAEKDKTDANGQDVKPVQDNSARNVEAKREEENERERESSYFIANVESPRSEKTEVFLEINPETERQKEWTVNLGNEKPVLILENANETAETKAAECSKKQDVALFQV